MATHQYSDLENAMDCIVHGVTKSRTRLSDFHFTPLSWWLSGKESACKTGNPGLIPGSERSTGEGIGYPLQYSWASVLALFLLIYFCPGYGS